MADNPLTPAGLLAPTYRNQLAFIDIFFRGMNNTNYNMAVCGTSGAGKTGLIQPLIRSVLDSGGFAVVFDMGDGYKSLCENMGGVYLDGETLRFNPFANITDIDQSAERVRDQLSVMASPNGNESSPLQSSLLVSERMAFKLHRQGMIMETIGKNNAVCNEYPSPILPKERWRYQMVNMYPDSGQCHPFGRSVTRWETGKNPPNTKKNFGYLMWRKRNCVFL